MTRDTRGRRGIALVVVLWTVALLATVTAMASSAARSSAAIASNMRAQAVSRSMAESGIVAASALIEDSLLAYGNNAILRDAFLARLEPRDANARPMLQDSLADGVFAVTVVDVSARLDVNDAGADGLAQLLATVTSPSAARATAERIDARVRGSARGSTRGGDAFADDSARARDSLSAALLGRTVGTRLRRPFESLDALLDVPGVDVGSLAKIASLLTVDGNGQTNRRAATPAVLAAASGTMVDAPSRLLLIARGWERGHALSRQIEAVYDVAADGLHLVRWREHNR